AIAGACGGFDLVRGGLGQEIVARCHRARGLEQVVVVHHPRAAAARPLGRGRRSRRNLPVYELGTWAICSGVPSATSSPPASPASGPRSITQSAVLITSRWCSTTSTV